MKFLFSAVTVEA